MLFRNCQLCKKEFRTFPAWIRKGEGKFCSKECRISASRGPDRKITPDGYVMIRCPGHPRPVAGDFQYEHVLIMESHLGRFLIPPEEIHHKNEIKHDNWIENLHLCKDKAEHRRMHRRMRIERLGGNPDTQKICYRCRQLKDLNEYSPSSSRGKPVLGSMCKPCAANFQKERRKEANANRVTA
jgi:hypothetical protein